MTPLLAHRPRTDRSFERLYQRHVGDVYRYALAVLRNQADAEDVTQTTFLNAYRAFERGERPDAPHNWLIAIAHNVCRQRFRQSARRPQEVTFEDDIADTVEDDDAPTAEDIRRALGHLAFNQRAALVMRELEGRSYAEIGEILGLSVSAVETLIFRARRALREQLEGSLTCGEAELAISKQLDGRLSRSEKGQLRAHLRECPDCASFARRQRAQRAALKSLGAVPLPASLASFFGGGGAVAVGGGLALKAAALLAAGAVASGVSYKAVHHVRSGHAPAAATPRRDAPAAKKAHVAQIPIAGGNVAPRLKSTTTHPHRPAANGHATKQHVTASAAAAKEHGKSADAKAQAPGQAVRAQHARDSKAVRAHGAPATAHHASSHAQSHRTNAHASNAHATTPHRAKPRRVKPHRAQPHRQHPTPSSNGNQHKQSGTDSSQAQQSVTDVLPTVSVPAVTVELPKPKK